MKNNQINVRFPGEEKPTKASRFYAWARRMGLDPDAPGVRERFETALEKAERKSDLRKILKFSGNSCSFQMKEK